MRGTAPYPSGVCHLELGEEEEEGEGEVEEEEKEEEEEEGEISLVLKRKGTGGGSLTSHVDLVEEVVSLRHLRGGDPEAMLLASSSDTIHLFLPPVP